MKTRTLTLLLCMVMVFSVLSPMALAASPELETPIDDPVDPAPYTYINSISMALYITNSGKSSDYCQVYVPNRSCTVYIYLDLQRKVSGASWDSATTVKSWSKSGSGTVTIDEDWYVNSGYVYRLAATVKVYDSDDLLGDSTTVYSTSCSYP